MVVCHVCSLLASHVSESRYRSHSHPYIHAHKNTQALPCDMCTSMLSPLQHLSPQRMITRFYQAVTAPLPVLIVPAGRTLLPLSPHIIYLHMVLLAYG